MSDIIFTEEHLLTLTNLELEIYETKLSLIRRILDDIEYVRYKLPKIADASKS